MKCYLICGGRGGGKGDGGGGVKKVYFRCGSLIGGMMGCGWCWMCKGVTWGGWSGSSVMCVI